MPPLYSNGGFFHYEKFLKNRYMGKPFFQMEKRQLIA